MDLDADVTRMIRGAPGAVTVVVGAVSDYGVEDVSRHDLFGGAGEVIERIREVLLANAIFAYATLTLGTTITVNGTAYTIRDMIREDDGRINRVICV